MVYLFGDLETYSYTYYRNNNKKIREYVIGAKDLDNTMLLEDVTIDGFLDQLNDLKQNSTTFIQNLSGFDGHFLINPIINKWGKSNVKYFMDHKNKIYEIKITRRYRDYEDLNEKGQPKRKKFVITFRDSWRIWPISIKMMGRAIGLDKLEYDEYDIEDTFDTIEDYKKHNNGKSYEYFIRDIDILVQFAKHTMHVMPLENYKMTIASTAMAEWRKTNSIAAADAKWSMVDKIEEGDETRWEVAYDHWRTVKKAYRGGITYVKPQHQLKLLSNVYVYDLNSPYPEIMRNDKVPYGAPEYDESKLTQFHTYKLYEVNIKYAMTDKMPFIAKPTSSMNDNIVEMMKRLESDSIKAVSDELKYESVLVNETVYINNYTLELFEKHYKGEWDIKFILAHKEKYGQFTEYINHFKNIKETSTGAVREIAKLFLTGLVGKFGQDIRDLKSEMLPLEEYKDQLEYRANSVYLDGEKVVINDGIIYKKVDNGLKRNISYIPIAEAITSKARIMLVEAINANWDIFVYCDTDSVHLLGPAVGLELHQTEFGKWKFEGCWDKAIYRRPKHYAHWGMTLNEKFEEVNDLEEFELKAGGFNINNFKDKKFMTPELYIQEEFTVEGGKTKSFVVDGGVIITEGSYNFTMPHGWNDETYGREVREKLVCTQYGPSEMIDGFLVEGECLNYKLKQ